MGLLSTDTGDESAGGSTTTTLSTNMTVDNSADYVLVMIIARDIPLNDISSLQYNGVSLTNRLSSQFSELSTKVWFFTLENPATGNNTITLTRATTDNFWEFSYVAWSLDGLANPSNPFDETSSNSNEDDDNISFDVDSGGETTAICVYSPGASGASSLHTNNIAGPNVPNVSGDFKTAYLTKTVSGNFDVGWQSSFNAGGFLAATIKFGGGTPPTGTGSRPIINFIGI